MQVIFQFRLSHEQVGKMQFMKQCSHEADFCQQISSLLDQGETIFGNMINLTLKNRQIGRNMNSA